MRAVLRERNLTEIFQGDLLLLAVSSRRGRRTPRMSEKKTTAAEILRSLSPEEQARVPEFTREQVELALEAGRRDREREERVARPAAPLPRVRFT